MRMLLLRIAGSKNYEELRTYINVIYPSFKQVAIARGLLDTDSEWVNTLTEAASFVLPAQLRSFFVTILTQCNPANPFFLWQAFKEQMSLDLLNNYRRVNQIPDYEFDDTIFNETLRIIEDNLRSLGLSLESYEGMPTCPTINDYNESTLIRIEKNINNLKHELAEKVPLLNYDQKQAYDQITRASDCSDLIEKVFFVDGPGGTGKTFLYKQVLNYVRSKNKIALAVASSGIAALLLPGGRTAHSRLKIPIKLQSTSTLNLPLQSDNADLIRKAEIILWDEAPMAHRHAYEALDRSLRDIMKTVDPSLSNMVFGGKIICFGGDFRQILPVVKKGTKSNTIAASLNKSYIWNYIKILKLTINERVKKYGNNAEAREFSEFLLEVGEGRLPTTNENFENDTVKIPEDMLIKLDEKTLIDAIYPNINE